MEPKRSQNPWSYAAQRSSPHPPTRPQAPLAAAGRAVRRRGFVGCAGRSSRVVTKPPHARIYRVDRHPTTALPFLVAAATRCSCHRLGEGIADRGGACGRFLGRGPHEPFLQARTRSRTISPASPSLQRPIGSRHLKCERYLPPCRSFLRQIRTGKVYVTVALAFGLAALTRN